MVHPQLNPEMVCINSSLIRGSLTHSILFVWFCQLYYTVSVYIYIYTHIYIYTYLYIYIYTRIYMYIYLFTYIYICMWLCNYLYHYIDYICICINSLTHRLGWWSEADPHVAPCRPMPPMRRCRSGRMASRHTFSLIGAGTIQDSGTQRFQPDECSLQVSLFRLFMPYLYILYSNFTYNTSYTIQCILYYTLKTYWAY